MKNIHLLPTEKPSRLYIYNGKLGFAKGFQYGTDTILNQHIYITSDEEIKEEDYVYSTAQDYNMQKVYKGLEKPYNDVEHYKKIILTTDKDLIKDGVQAVDDEFLEWFVKNPSCEWVEVNYELGSCLNCEWNHDMCPNTEECLKNTYKIIILKEIQKQHLIDMMKADEEIGLYEEIKQETLEEYISEVTKNFKDEMSIKFISGGVKLGVKWQQEQNKKLYSEEDMIEFADFYYQYKELIKLEKWEIIEISKKDVFKKWFEQYKKNKS